MSSDFIPLVETSQETDIPSAVSPSSPYSKTHMSHQTLSTEDELIHADNTTPSPTTQTTDVKLTSVRVGGGGGGGGDMEVENTTPLLERTPVDKQLHRFPYAIVWGPLPILT